MPDMSDNDLDRATRILRAVMKKTERKEMSWESVATSRRKGAYEADLTNGNVEIGYADNDGAPPYDFGVFGPAPDYTPVYKINGRRNPELESELQALHALVSRQILGVDTVFEALLAELEDEDE